VCFRAPCVSEGNMEAQPHIKIIFKRYLDNQSTAAELDFLFGFFGTVKEPELRELISEALFAEDQKAISGPDYQQKLQLIYRKINQHIVEAEQELAPPAISQRSVWPRIAAAASILLFLSVGGYFLLRNAKPQQQQIAQAQKPDLQPGTKKAVLILSGGKVISLGDAKAGTIATQGNTNITKTADNQIVYNNTKQSSKEMIYNTIVTKRGNFYPLKLSDGTVAILDAASSIKYPVNFTGNERRVEITGQVYFEVVHNANMPFKVTVRGQTIEDIGTHFNINAYDDEPTIKTTLIEGSVRINHDVVLEPGQQAIIQNGITKVGNVNTEQVIAWKNGLFSFKGTPISEVMRQLSRWYDVDVEYPNGLPKTTFTGEMHRNINASQVLEVLGYFKVHFQIVADSEGKKIIVKP